MLEETTPDGTEPEVLKPGIPTKAGLLTDGIITFKPGVIDLAFCRFMLHEYHKFELRIAVNQEYRIGKNGRVLIAADFEDVIEARAYWTDEVKRLERLESPKRKLYSNFKL